MEICNSFHVKATPSEAWAFLLDPEKLAPCMPGAELVEIIDERHWRGRVRVKFGPVALAFEGTITVVDLDEPAYRIQLHGAGKDSRGRGGATTDIDVTLTELAGPGTTHVELVQDMVVSGQIAQFGRGMMTDVSTEMTRQFAQRLEAGIIAERVAAEGRPLTAGGSAAHGGSAPHSVTRSPAPSRPRTGGAPPADNAISGFRMLLLMVQRLLARLPGRRRIAGGGRSAS